MHCASGQCREAGARLRIALCGPPCLCPVAPHKQRLSSPELRQWRPCTHQMRPEQHTAGVARSKPNGIKRQAGPESMFACSLRAVILLTCNSTALQCILEQPRSIVVEHVSERSLHLYDRSGRVVRRQQLPARL